MPRLRPRSRRRKVVLERHPDDLPKVGLFAEPIRLVRLDAMDPDIRDDGSLRAVFLAEVKDAEGRRCPDLAVEAIVEGPERSRTVQGSTDLLGRVRFRMAGPPGTYRIRITDVAAGGLAWDAAAGPREVTARLG